MNTIQSLYIKYKNQNAIIRISLFTFAVKAIAICQYYLTDDAVGDVAMSMANALLYNFIFVGMVFSVLLLLWHFLTRFRDQLSFLAFLYMFFSILITLIDLFLIRVTGMRFSPSILKTYGLKYIVTPDVVPTLIDNPLVSVTILLIPIGIILLFLRKKKLMSNKDTAPLSNSKIIIGSTLFIICWLALSSIHSSYYLSSRAAEIAFLKPSAYMGKTALRFNESDRERGNSLIEKYLDRKIENKNFPLLKRYESDSSKVITEYPDVFFIMIETLRGLELSFINNRDPADTPTLDSLSDHGVSFTKFMSNGYPTDDGMFAAHSSIIPHFKRKNVRDNIETQYSIIPDILRDQGYTTSMIASVKPFAPMLVWFEKWYDSIEYKCGKRRCNEYEIFQAAKSTIVEHDSSHTDQPIFYYIHTNDLHSPFYTKFSILKDSLGRKSYSTKRPEKEKDVRKRYKNTLKSTDFALGKFLHFLSQRRNSDNTIVILLGDHSREAGEPFEHGTRLYPMNPMMLTGAIISGSEKYIGLPRKEAFPASGVDILPTLAGCLNLDIKIATYGRNILADDLPKTSINVRPGGIRYNWGDSSLFINSYNPNDYWVTTFMDSVNDKSSYQSPQLQQKAREIYDLVQYGSYLIEENKLVSEDS